MRNKPIRNEYIYHCDRAWFCTCNCAQLCRLSIPPGIGVLDLSLGRGVPPGPWNPDPVYEKKFVKIMENWYPVYDFQVKFHSFFHQNAWFLDPVYKRSSEILCYLLHCWALESLGYAFFGEFISFLLGKRRFFGLFLPYWSSVNCVIRSIAERESR